MASAPSASAARSKLKSLDKEAQQNQMIDDLYRRSITNPHGSEGDATGNELMKKANKTLNKTLAGSSKYDKAAALFEEAANAFLNNDNLEEAANAMVKAAELYETKIDPSQPILAAQKYSAAANCLAQANEVDKAADLYQMAAEIYSRENSMQSAAKVFEEIGELWEADGDLMQAYENYEKAFDFYNGDDKPASAVQSLLKMAAIQAKREEYKSAAKHYEQAAQLSMDASINQGSEIKWFYKSMLCTMVSCAARWSFKKLHRKIEKYYDINRRFQGTREFTVIEQCMKAFEEDDLDEFTSAVYNFNRQSKLSDNEAELFLKVKQQLKLGDPKVREEQVDAEQVAEELM